jgi:glycosyltransferase involved in cell wall biosynthesis
MGTQTPDSVFDEEKYLEANSDVREAVERGQLAGAADHYYKYGLGEGRESFWTVIGKDRSYQCDVILIDGLVDVVDQYWSLHNQKLLDIHFYVISTDPEKFNLPQDKSRVTLISSVGESPHIVVHYLVPNLQSDFIIFSVPVFQHEDYVRSQINRLQNSGREVLVRVGFEYGNLIIIRKNTFLDMGGFKDTPYYYLEDLIQRATLEERPFDRGEVLRSASADRPSEITQPLRRHAIGYKQHKVTTDVVLPFYGHLDFAEEAIRSVVDQNNADTVVHLIDDCSREDTSEFLNRWKSHGNVRIYRNNVNIGQFMSVNNVVPFLETEYIALMDGDDISAGNRFHEGINLMELTRSDIFGSRIKMFGDEYEWAIKDYLTRVWLKRDPRHWNCTYPHEIGYHYFPNPTVIMTKKSFVDIGGYADFGDVEKNKTSNDTELLYRYFFSGHCNCYSVSCLVDVRKHGSSCTQNLETGWTSPNRIWAHRTVEQRRKIFFEDRKFVASAFGSLEHPRWKQYTQPWEG